MNPAKIRYRTGQPEDCERLAELDNIASGGTIDYLFRDLVPAKSPVEIVADILKNHDGSHSYNNTFVAAYQQVVIGFALSFSAEHHRINDEMRAFLPPDRLTHFKDFFSSRVDHSLYLDALCVDRDFRNAGIGGRLIEMTREKALRQGFGTLSLIVFADNTAARHLYEKKGFEIVKKVDLEEDERIPHKGGCLLMKCNLS